MGSIKQINTQKKKNRKVIDITKQPNVNSTLPKQIKYFFYILFSKNL